MPFYKVVEQGSDKPRMVKAQSAKAAIQFVVGKRYEATTISSVEEAVDLYEAGIKVEDAMAEPEPQPEPDGATETATVEEPEVGKGGKPPKTDA